MNHTLHRDGSLRLITKRRRGTNVIANIDKDLTTWERIQASWAQENRIGNRIFHILEGDPIFKKDESRSKIMNCMSIFMILLSCTVFCVDTMPEFYSEVLDDKWISPLFYIDVVCVLYFTAEIAIRALFRPREIPFWDFFSMIDVFSVGGFYIEITLGLAGAENQSGATAFVRVLRLSRTLRVLKVTRYSEGLKIVGVVMACSKESLMLLCFLIGIAVVFFSTLLFFCEISINPHVSFSPEEKVWLLPDGTMNDIQSIPDAFWWAIVTISSVGYGDQVPYTWAGKVVAIATMLFALLTISLPTVLIGANFTKVSISYKMSRAQRKLLKIFNKIRAIIRFQRMLRQIRSLKAVNNFTPAIIERTASTSIARNVERSHDALTNVLRSGIFDAEGTEFEIDMPDNLSEWTFEDCPNALSILRQLLIVFSGATSLNSVLPANKTNQPLLHLAACGLIRVFLCDVDNPEHSPGVLRITEKGIDYLLVEKEDRNLRCCQSVAAAQGLWRDATMDLEPFPVEMFREIHKFYKVWWEAQSHLALNESKKKESPQEDDSGNVDEEDDFFVEKFAETILASLKKAVAKLEAEAEENDKKINALRMSMVNK